MNEPPTTDDEATYAQYMDDLDKARQRIEQLERGLSNVLAAMRIWSADEDGIHDGAYGPYVAACQLVDSRYCHVIIPGMQSCGSCMALDCGDNTNVDAKAALEPQR